MSSSEQIAPLIDVERLGRTYGTLAGDFVALKDVTLAVDAGKFVAVVGRSGSGKSTLMNLIAGLDRPTAGQVRIGGTLISALDESALARWRGRNVGVVFQFFQLLPTLTILENVMLPMDFCGTLPPKEARERALWLLSDVGIPEQAHKLPTALSGGQQQRAAIARALANDPPLIVADEPTGNLDAHTADKVLELLGALTRRGTTVLTVTHERDISSVADVVIHLADGAVTRVERSSHPARGGSHVAA